MHSSFDRATVLAGANADFIGELYARFLDSPGSVDGSWAELFTDIGDGSEDILRELRGASWSPTGRRVLDAPTEADELAAESRTFSQNNLDEVRQAAYDSIRAFRLIRAYRVRGHLKADLDPLKLDKRQPPDDLDPAYFGFDHDDYGREIYLGGLVGMESATMRQLLATLNEIYCGKVGVQFMHIQSTKQRNWIQDRIERERNQSDFSLAGKRAILERLTEGEIFERYLEKKYVATKRFGLEGGESTLPALEQILKRGGQLGLKDVVLGMPHRGRLNILANVVNKPLAAIFSEFQGSSFKPDDVQGSGDVKYHLGTSADRDFNGNIVHLSLTANPSHLEAVNTVVLGKVRAKQIKMNMAGDSLDEARCKVMGLLLHGDAAFSGQGLVYETLDLAGLKGYKTGGTIHFIVNNQIGFTTSPAYSRSSPYCSDVAMGVQAPIFHVNGDDPEAVVHAARMAIEYRQEFLKDVVLDLICYRRHGHNEADEPAFTQPVMYRKISQHPTTRTLYADTLAHEGVVSQKEANSLVDAYREKLDQAFGAAESYKPNKADWLEGVWSGFEQARGEVRRGKTAVSVSALKSIGTSLTSIPEGFKANPKIIRLMKEKRAALDSGTGIDWAMAEALAFGSLLVEETPVRLSGQDSGRGTFSHRHAILIDQENEERYIPLNHINQQQALFEIIDSPLSEAGVLGFEYGYSLAEPHALVIWEAQFGDFANGAQVIIDQFIASGESKWLRMSGLVLLLPHGLEGQGPEHSSARLERYLQLCAEDNIQVANCTTPANYFHILRRQLRRRFRKPLIIMAPKSLLRHKQAVSHLADMGVGTSFHRLLWDNPQAVGTDDEIKRLILCSGKIYYDLAAERDKRKIRDIYILRLEQIYPFPQKSLIREMSRFGQAEVVWCQEEHKNMGAWSFVAPKIEDLMLKMKTTCTRPIYIGRPEAAVPATGLMKQHIEEQKCLLDQALTV